MRYEPVLNPREEPVNKEDSEVESDIDFEVDTEANELEPLVCGVPQPRSSSPSPAHQILGGLFSSTTHGNRLAPLAAVSLTPATPVSSDGVFANIPAKPTSARERLAAEEELGEDEWIFMTPEQRTKLAPPVCFFFFCFTSHTMRWDFLGVLNVFFSCNRNTPRSNVIGRHDIPLSIPRQPSLSALAPCAAHQLLDLASTPSLRAPVGILL